MQIDEKILKQMEEDREHQDYRLEKMLLDFTAEICAKMDELHINRSELAKRLGTSRAFVSKIMGCNHNINLKTMDSISHAVGLEIKLQVQEIKRVEEEVLAKKQFVLYSFPHRSNTISPDIVKVGGEEVGALLSHPGNIKRSISKVLNETTECDNDNDYDRSQYA